MKLSIIVPNYNNSKFLQKCIESILKQTFCDYELIIIDDGSTDDSKKIIDKFSDDRIIKIFQYNQNGAIARNRGLEIARGKYIFFLDSDDELYDDHVLERMLKEIKNNDLLLTNYCTVDENSNFLEYYDIEKDNKICVDTKYKYSLISPVPSNKLYKNDIIKKYNLFFDNVRIGQDLNFYLKYLCVIESVKICDFYSYNYRILNNSVSRIKNLNFFDIYNTFKCIKKYYSNMNFQEEYNKYISLCELIHYNTQFNKIKYSNNNKEKKIIYNFMLFCFSTINYKKCYKGGIYKKYRFKVLIKKIVYLL